MSMAWRSSRHGFTGRERTWKRAPMPANFDSMCFVFIGLVSWTSARRAKHKGRLGRRSDSKDTDWLVALAVEQLALETEDWSHGIPFGLVVVVEKRCVLSVRSGRRAGRLRASGLRN